MMTGFPMGGTPPLSADDLKMVRRCIRPQPIEYYKGTKGILASWLKTNYVWAIDESSEGERDYSTWTFLLYMLTWLVFYAKTDRVYFCQLLALEDLDRVGFYSWGKSALG